MPDTDYTIRYTAPPDKINRDIDGIIAKLKQLDVQVDKTKGKLRLLGSDTAGLTKLISGLKAVDKELQNKVTDAGKASKALSEVGKDNRAITSLTTRLKELEAELAKVLAGANAAAAGLTGVGQGVKLPGQGGGGTGAGGASGISRMAAGLGRHVAFSAFRATARAVGTGAAERRSFFSQASDMASDYRKDLQELAVLQGKPSADNGLIREQLAFGKSTGLNPEDAAEFRLEYGGAIAPGKAKGNIDDATIPKLEAEAARFGNRYGLDPKTSGRMAGLLPNYAKVPDAAAGVGKMAASAEYLNIYGLGTPRSMAGPMVALQADMLDSEEGGRFDSLESLSARFGSTTFAARSPAAAATQIRQANRLIRKFNGGDEEKFLRNQGITPDMDYETAMHRLAPALTGANPDLVLAQAGFANSTERDSAIKQIRLNGVVDKAKTDPRIEAARAGAVQANAAFAGSLTGRQQGAENDEFAATIEAGMTGEALKAGRTSARARMIAEGRLKTRGIGEALADSFRSMTESGGGVSGEDLNVDREAVAELKRRAAAAGVDLGSRYPGLNENAGYFSKDKGVRFNTTAGTDEAGFQAQFNAASNEVDAARKVDQAGRLLIDAAKGMGGGNQRPGPAMPPPPGNGGAGFNPGRR
jgi:hypothetical protein